MADGVEGKKHHFRNTPMLRELKHPNVIEFFDYGEIATGEVGILLADMYCAQRRAVSGAALHLSGLLGISRSPAMAPDESKEGRATSICPHHDESDSQGCAQQVKKSARTANATSGTSELYRRPEFRPFLASISPITELVSGQAKRKGRHSGACAGCQHFRIQAGKYPISPAAWAGQHLPPLRLVPGGALLCARHCARPGIPTLPAGVRASLQA